MDESKYLVVHDLVSTSAITQIFDSPVIEAFGSEACSNHAWVNFDIFLRTISDLYFLQQ
jgi:hypothetical protein